MSDISERYARLSSAFAAKLAAVPPDRWTGPSPCADWTTRDLVRHVVEVQGMFLGFVGLQVGDAPGVDDDPVGAFEVARAAVQDALDDPAQATAPFEGFGGPTTLQAAVDRFVNFDLVVHGWDLARAAGLDERIDPADVDRVAAAVAEFGDLLYESGSCHRPLEAPPGADDQARMLASVGRHAWR